ncbi:mannose-1-phosphate guanylyltransferase/mannose-6-phosphate isomerase [Citrobacter amalonaticus]|uniref:mannose-1-phosphate guanylyltransferase/mannose-6-phosphate isomerase n=1 Tax=Citrobacter amalonaticus TaxID=35703 RepID=UPI00292C3317|nr:mannose-1-phosphate guanylyltransferase/mannose-6-phosphate isomerase [Citrobacter amalonaticus]MDV0783664.1 mannose-1-phosphate guanylyltransferase/mannose-6-phosphate isomerase [Citrobacter amalonaticus]MEB0639727.1 mannose-1-phosphate guanylyltransferase/mannose-6-phosphate isomerase [Citrobacter amalonaticus]
MSNSILPVVMAGGTGSRLWPLSRTLYPKQFLSLTSENSMLQETITRLNGLKHEHPLIICNEEHRFIVAEQLRQLNIQHNGIILEPVGRNTAPAIALAAMHAVKNNADPLLLVLAADHVIQDNEAFIKAVEDATELANSGKLVTFGIVPNKPETGYGYIKQGNKISAHAYSVEEFVEKPDLETARKYIDAGTYYWNSGMFIFKASRYLKELAKFRPDIIDACSKALNAATFDLDFTRLDMGLFTVCPDESIDYAVMEKTNDAVVVPLDANWSDVGSWSALWEVDNKDQDQNVIHGDVIAIDTQRSYLYSQHRLISTVGLSDVIVVETKDAVLVSHKDEVQSVKDVVNTLKSLSRNEYLQHRELYRPWGTSDAVSEGSRYHVRKVTVKPGERTATQIHYHRAEHWIVVTGTAKVYCDSKVHLLTENESTYIPVGIPHSLENPGKIPLEIIEVRTGTYLDDDDIVRLEQYSHGSSYEG